VGESAQFFGESAAAAKKVLADELLLLFKPASEKRFDKWQGLLEARAVHF